MASAGVVSFVPVSYIASPLPTYTHAQNTLTGEYAYNYAGGPSAKEEIKTLDGVTRGAYSYVDGFGIVQSAQYVADDNGFRVVATNVPTDAQIGVNVPLETPEVQAAKAAHFAEHAKAIAALGRRKRSLSYEHAPVAVSTQYHNQKHESVKIETPVYEYYHAAPAPLVDARYHQVLAAVSSAPTAVSHQSRVQTHSGARLEVSAPLSYDVQVVKSAPEVINYHEAVEVPVAHVDAVHLAPVAVSSVPTAVSSQSRHQVHNNQKIEVHTPVYQSVAPVVHEADSIAVEAVRTAVPAVISSVPTAVSRQSRSQIHRGNHVEFEVPKYYTAQVFDSYGVPVAVPNVATLAAQVADDQASAVVPKGHSLDINTPVWTKSQFVSQVPLDTPEVAAAKEAHARAYAGELAKHQGW